MDESTVVIDGEKTIELEFDDDVEDEDGLEDEKVNNDEI